MTTLTAARPRIVKRAARGRVREANLLIGEHRAFQGELFDELPGGRQSATRLRHMRESMDAIDTLFHESIRRHGAAAFTDFLAFVSRFNRYSAFNAMLIEMQRPGAAAVASREQWAIAGRAVQPGAIPIAILWPFAPVRWVYELADTDVVGGRAKGADGRSVLGAVPAASWLHTTAAADRLGVSVELTDRWSGAQAGPGSALHETAHASTGVATSRRHRWLVLVSDRLDERARFATLAHELAHIYCGHLGAHPEGYWPDRSGALSRAQRELEAEAVAHVVCRRLVLKSRPTPYLRRHITAANLLGISKRLIIEAVNRIEARS